MAPGGMKLPPLRDLLSMYDIHARKELSQNFFVRPDVAHKVARLLVPPLPEMVSPGGTLVVEVGAGPGGLSRSLVGLGAGAVVGIEKDESFVPLLEQLRDSTNGKFRFLIADMLKTNQQSLTERILAEARLAFTGTSDKTCAADGSDPGVPRRIHLTGNLPFSISSPLLSMWVEQAAARKGLFATPATSIGVVLQAEVCQRLSANPGVKLRGQLSVMCQTLFDVTYAASIGRGLFYPVPKVTSGVIRMVKKPRPQIYVPDAADSMHASVNGSGDVPYDTFARIVQALHTRNNATIRRSLNQQGLQRVADILHECGIDSAARVFTLELDAFLRLTRMCVERGIDLSRSRNDEQADSEPNKIMESST